MSRSQSVSSFPRRTVGWLVLGLVVPTSAWAVDLASLVEAWTRSVDGQSGSDGVDAALGTVLDSAGNVVTVGYLDGAVDHGSDGYAIAWDPTGATLWELTEDVGAVGPDRSSSDDRLNAVAIDPVVDDFAFCGTRGGEVTDDPANRYLVEGLVGNGVAAPVVDWTIAYEDGPASVDQACFGTTRADGNVYATGWAVHDTDDAGRWFTWKFDETNGQALAAIPYEFSDFIAVPDQAYDVALNTVTGEFAAVGTRGFAGIGGSLQNDTDWHVRYFDATGSLLWEHTLAGDQQLEDKALGVAIDSTTGDVYVVGSTNEGDDNGPGADLDWLVISYDRDGDGLGGAQVKWTQTWGSVPLASEGATAVVLDDVRDLLVGGWRVDPVSGVDQWRVAKLLAADGVQLQEWIGPARAGDSRVTAIDFRSAKIAIAGTTDDGAGPDFAGTVLEGDLDGDGVADSVDACPDDPDKAADDGVCGCNVPDIDSDGDGVESCIDDCPQDPAKVEVGECGCGNEDLDTDGDLTFDCNDDCPTDPEKTGWGVCGCNAPDSDTDGDGVIGCDDACSNTPPDTEVDSFGCPLEDGDETGDTGADPTDVSGDKGGCGCATGDAPAVGALLPLLALLAVRRRQRL